MATGDDAGRGGPASEPADDLPFLPPARSTPGAPISMPAPDETPPATPADRPAESPAEPPDGAPVLPPRPEGAPVAARLSPPLNAPIASSRADMHEDTVTSEPSGPDPEVIAALQANATRLRRRNRAVRAALALVVILGVAAAVFFGYRAYDREQDDRQPPTTERPTSQELLDRLDRDD